MYEIESLHQKLGTEREKVLKKQTRNKACEFKKCEQI